MNNIEYWKLIIVGIAIATFLFDVLRKKAIKPIKHHMRGVLSATLVIISMLLIRNCNQNAINASWGIIILAASSALGDLVNILRSNKLNTEPAK